MRLDEAGPLVVLGAGPAGSLLATYLGQQGHQVVVYESRPDMRTTDIGAGRSINLALATRGIVPLLEIGVMDKVADIVIPMQARAIHAGEPNGDGSFDVMLQPYGTQKNEIIHSVSRSDLNAIILDAAEATGNVEIRFNQRCRQVDFDRKVLTFTNGTSADPTAEYEVPFGVVFGTDGSASPVREAMTSPSTTVSVEPLDHDYKELTLAPGADGDFQIEPNALHIWPKGQYMLIALPNPERDFTVTLFMPAEPVPGSSDTSSFAGLGTVEQVDAFFAEKFPDFAALVPDLAEQFFENPTGKLATVRTTGWNRGADSVLVGDAAHAIVPFHGQGMNAAMESCRVLHECLLEHAEDVEAAFVAFEAVRKVDADAIADMALDNYVEMRSGVVDPDYLIKRELALELQRRWPERIAPRYAMVMFSTMPYSQAQERAALQAKILTELCRGCDTIDDVDFVAAEALVNELDLLRTDVGEPQWQ